MKILAIMGCSKNGSTTEIVRYFEKTLTKSEECEFEYLYLQDYLTDFCTGCHNCIFIGEDKCPHYDQVKVIEDKMLNTEVVLLATPGYMFSVTGIMKNFLDHVAYNCHRPKYFGKKIFLISSCTKQQEKGVFIPMETWATATGFTFMGKFYMDMLPLPFIEEEVNKKRRFIEREVKRFKEQLGKKRKLVFGDVVIFHVFRSLCQTAPKIFKADYEYFKAKDAYNGSTKWYIPAQVNWIHHHAANFIERSMKKGIGKMLDTKQLEQTENRYKIKL